MNEKRLGWQHVNHVDIQKRKREGTRHKIFVQPGLLKLPFGLAHSPLTKNSVVRSKLGRLVVGQCCFGLQILLYALSVVRSLVDECPCTAKL